MTITVNGQERDMPEGANVATLLDDLGLTGPLAVELNRRVCPRAQHTQTQLNPGDVVEIVTIVGGGR